MNCYLASFIGIGMLGATFSTMTLSEDQINHLRKTFKPELVEIYNKIVIERRNHYLQGLALGILLAFVLLKFMRPKTLFHKIMVAFAIIIPTSVLYYSVMPKSDYMLNHLKTPEENKAWLQVYNNMKYSYLYGFILGSLCAVPVAYVMC
jgi:hypothetical protein